MKNVYSCPHCQAVLNPSVKILLKIGFKRKKGMILLSPQPGNFKFICDSSLENAFKEGDRMNFSCPVCSADLTSPGNKKFAQLQMTAPGDKIKWVEFSRVFGKRATFIFHGDEVTAFGDDVDDMGEMNFFGV